jgi:hypothetical protein
MVLNKKKVDELIEIANTELNTDNAEPVKFKITVQLSNTNSKYFRLLQHIAPLLDLSEEDINTKIVELGIDSVFKTLWGSVVLTMMKQVNDETSIKNLPTKGLGH